MLLEGRTEATRPQWRIPCQKGWRGMWSPHGLGMGGEDESADVVGRWGRCLAMWGGGGKLGWSMERWKGGKVQVDCGARPFGEKGAPLFLKGAPLWGKGRSCCLLGRRFGDFLLFFHAVKSWWQLDPLAVIQVHYTEEEKKIHQNPPVIK